jgi:hypothetical protein
MKRYLPEWIPLGSAFACVLFVVPFIANAIVASPVADGPLVWLKAGDYEHTESYFTDLQHRYEAGQLSDQQLYQGFRNLYQDDPANAGYFDQWVKAYPKSFAARVARGAYFYRMAWAARGEEFIANTPPESIERMEGYLAHSRPDLIASLAMTAKPYLSALYLLNVEMLNGSSKARRQWLDRGTAIDPNNRRLRVRYMVSLQPRWGGSIDEMRAFIAECTQEKASTTTLNALKAGLANEVAEEARARKASPTEMLARWDEVVQLSQSAGEPPPTRALVGYARSAWVLNRRTEADRALAQLARLDVNDASSLSQMGWIYVQENRMPEGWAVLTKAAALNDAWSQFAVGKTLIQGCADINLPADRRAGLAWMQRSADQGFTEAVAYLAANKEKAVR